MRAWATRTPAPLSDSTKRSPGSSCTGKKSRHHWKEQRAWRCQPRDRSGGALRRPLIETEQFCGVPPQDHFFLVFGELHGLDQPMRPLVDVLATATCVGTIVGRAQITMVGADHDVIDAGKLDQEPHGLRIVGHRVVVELPEILLE